MERVRLAIDAVADTWTNPHEPAPSSESDGTSRPEVADTSVEDLTGNAERADIAEESPTAGEPDRQLLSRFRPTARSAIQVLVATGLAILAGQQLSGSRWFWAVITAFVVFTGVSSRAETLHKRWQRTIGTLAGVVAGVIVAALAGGNTIASVVIILACVFFAFYFAQVSSGLMIFWITVMLALLYGLMGQFSIGLLVLWLEETAIGAAIGASVAYLVLPTRTRSTVAQAGKDFLDALGELVTHSCDVLVAGVEADQLLPEAQALSGVNATLRTRAYPVTRGIAGLTGRSNLRRVLGGFDACEHFGRTLARHASAAHRAALAGTVPRAGARVRANIEALAEALSGSEPTIRSADPELDAVQRQLEQAGEVRHLLAAVRSLRRLDETVIALATAIGAMPEEQESGTESGVTSQQKT